MDAVVGVRQVLRQPEGHLGGDLGGQVVGQWLPGLVAEDGVLLPVVVPGGSPSGSSTSDQENCGRSPPAINPKPRQRRKPNEGLGR